MTIPASPILPERLPDGSFRNRPQATVPAEARAANAASHREVWRVFLRNMSRLLLSQDERQTLARIALEYPARMDGDGFEVTLVGHSTTLLRFGGLTLLTDPIFSTRCSPVQFAGPKRVLPPTLPLADLPELDVVVVSHDHYDHLDDASVRALARRFGDKLLWVCPAGVEPWLRARGARTIWQAETWWNSREFPNGLCATCAPAQHFSGRGMHNRNGTLWCSWVLEAGGKLVYFGGDSGYFGAYQQLREAFQSFDLALIPIGAYDPEALMGPIHMSPEDAVQAFEDLNARLLVPIHWGAFKLTLEHMAEPPQRLLREWERRGLDPDRLWLLSPGLRAEDARPG